MSDMRGSIVFYSSYGASWQDRFLTSVVQRGTSGPYVHCEMIYEETEPNNWLTIGAHSTGIELATLPTDASLYRLVPLQNFSVDAQGEPIAIDPADLSNALRWAYAHLGMSYGAIDNITQSIDLLWASCPIHVSQPDHFNCSNFLAAIMDKAGIILPKSFTYPFDVSPNDLAEYAGLLPLRHRIKK